MELHTENKIRHSPRSSIEQKNSSNTISNHRIFQRVDALSSAQVTQAVAEEVKRLKYLKIKSDTFNDFVTKFGNEFDNPLEDFIGVTESQFQIAVKKSSSWAKLIRSLKNKNRYQNLTNSSEFAHGKVVLKQLKNKIIELAKQSVDENGFGKRQWGWASISFDEAPATNCDEENNRYSKQTKKKNYDVPENIADMFEIVEDAENDLVSITRAVEYVHRIFVEQVAIERKGNKPNYRQPLTSNFYSDGSSWLEESPATQEIRAIKGSKLIRDLFKRKRENPQLMFLCANHAVILRKFKQELSESPLKEKTSETFNGVRSIVNSSDFSIKDSSSLEKVEKHFTTALRSYPLFRWPKNVHRYQNFEDLKSYYLVKEVLADLKEEIYQLCKQNIFVTNGFLGGTTISFRVKPTGDFIRGKLAIEKLHAPSYMKKVVNAIEEAENNEITYMTALYRVYFILREAYGEGHIPVDRDVTSHVFYMETYFYISDIIQNINKNKQYSDNNSISGKSINGDSILPLPAPGVGF